jgi:GyrI-like small molecule binding protein
MTATPREYGIVTVERQLTAVVKAQVRMDEIPHAERSSRKKLDAALPSLDVGPLGRTFTLWRPPTDGRLYLEPGIVVARSFAAAGEVVPSELPAGRTAHFLLVGPYEGLPGAWQKLFDWCSAEGLKLAGTNWQIYAEDDPAQPQTSLHALLA